MTYCLHHETHRSGLRLLVNADDDPINPRTDLDNPCQMICWHTRYRLGDDHQWATPDDFQRAFRQSRDLILPLYLYDHSGLTMATTPFSCPWDSGQVGWIVLERQVVLIEFGGKRMTRARREQGYALMRAEVAVYDQYLRGDIWSVLIEDPAGDVLDCCSGFYGGDDAVVEGRSMLAECVAANAHGPTSTAI